MALALPSFSYSGGYATAADENYWYIYLTSNGTLKMSFAQEVDVWLVGAGAGASNSTGKGAGGGGMTLGTGLTMEGAAGYDCVIGKGGAQNTNGGNTTFMGLTAGGGQTSGTGGSGTYAGGAGGENGANGGAGRYPFNDATRAAKYGGGGGSGAYNGSVGTHAAGLGVDGGGNGGAAWGGGSAAAGSAATDYGGGGGGTGRSQIDSDGSIAGNAGGAGANGVVIIRGKGGDFMPVFYANTQISEVYYAGAKMREIIKGEVQMIVQAVCAAVKRIAGKEDKCAGFAF